MSNIVHQSGVVASITGFQGEVLLKSGGEFVTVKPNTIIFVDDVLETKGASAVMVSLANGLTFSLGHDQKQTVSKAFLESLLGDAEDSIDEAVNFAAIEQSLEDGKNLQEILPETAAGEDVTPGFASGEYYRVDLTLAEVVPERGFDTRALLDSDPSDFQRPIDFTPIDATEPSVPDVPDDPDPSVPDEPDIPDEPSVPDVPDVPTNPDGPGAGNNAPLAADIEAQQVVQDAVALIDLSQYFSDADSGQILSYQLSPLPEGLVFDAINGVISGAATNLAALTNEGNYRMRITASDDSAAENNSVTTEFTLSVLNVNDLPELDNVDLGAVEEDNSVLISTAELLASASDIDGDNLSVDSLILAEGNGTVSFVNGDYTFTPADNWHGVVRFVNTVSDGNGGSVSADVNLVVTAVNDAPVAAVIPLQQVIEDAPTTLDLSGYFSDVDSGQRLSFEVSSLPEGLVFDPSSGIISGAATNSAALSNGGEYQITLTAKDDSGAENNSVSRVFTLEVINTNDLPTVSDIDLPALLEDNQILIDSASLLANASDIDGDLLSVESLALVEGNGTLTLVNGDYIFTPADNWYGSVRFVNTVSDGNGGSASANVNLVVTPVNDAPVAANIPAQQVIEDTQTTLDLASYFSDVDIGQSLSFAISALPEGLTFDPVNAVIVGAATNAAALANGGNYQITITATDDSGAANNSVAAQFTLTVQNSNDVPEVADIDLGVVNEDNSVVIDVETLLAAATDIDGDALSIDSLILLEGDGSLSFENGAYVFSPAADWFGEVRFVSTVSDAQSSASGSVRLVVAPVNDAPVAAQDGPVDTFENAAVTINVLANDSDVDGDTLSVLTASANLGDVTINADGSLNYVPNLGYFGQDTLSYTIADGNGGQAESIAIVNVIEINDAPKLGEDVAVAVYENTTAVGQFEATDENGDAISYSLSGDDAALFNVDVEGRVFFIDPPDFETDNGPFTITLRATDDGLGNLSDEQVITVTVLNVNDNPPQIQISGSVITEDAVAAGQVIGRFSVSDLDGDTVSVSAYNNQANYFEISGDTLLLTEAGVLAVNNDALNLNSIELSLSGDDGENTVIASAQVDIIRVNDAPQIEAQIPDQYLLEDFATYSINLGDYFADAETPDSELRYSISTAENILISIDGAIASVASVLDWNGNETLTVTATDADGASVSTDVNFIVEAVNDAPVAFDLPVQQILEDTPLYTIDLYPVFDDIETADLDLVLTFEGGENISVTLENGLASFTPQANWSGVESIEFTATDAEGLSVTSAINFEVIAVADAPSVAVGDSVAGDGLKINPPVSTGLTLRYYEDLPVQEQASLREAISDAEAPSSVTRLINGVGFPKLIDNTRILQTDGSTIAIPEGDAYALTGFIFIEAGQSFELQGYHDDVMQVELGGSTILSTGGDSFGNIGPGGSVSADVFTATETGYYTFEAYVANNYGVGQFALNFSVDGGEAMALTANNFSIYASISDLLAQAAQFSAFVPGEDRADGGYFPTVINEGLSAQFIEISNIEASLRDTDGSESITSLLLGDIPEGSVLTDGERLFTATSDLNSVDLVAQSWDLNNLQILPPAGFLGDFSMRVVATSTEMSNGDQASTEAFINVSVLDADGGIDGVDPEVLNVSTVVLGSNDDDALSGTEASETFIAGAGDDVISAGGGNDFVNAGVGFDTLFGDAGEDLLFGGSGNDQVDGGAGNDILSGGRGSDQITGGEGADIVIWRAGDGDNSRDSLIDFDVNEDVLHFADLLEGESSDAVILDAYFDFSSDGNTTQIAVDVDGDGSGADLNVTLLNVDLLGIYGQSDQAILSNLLVNGNLTTD
ncbi:MAG: retention module-containing protein [Cellvibrionaceae bacterium]|nr:retention module-containing protein [Cellvibrionaceae bacterium]